MRVRLKDNGVREVIYEEDEILNDLDHRQLAEPYGPVAFLWAWKRPWSPVKAEVKLEPRKGKAVNVAQPGLFGELDK